MSNTPNNETPLISEEDAREVLIQQSKKFVMSFVGSLYSDDESFNNQLNITMLMSKGGAFISDDVLDFIDNASAENEKKTGVPYDRKLAAATRTFIGECRDAYRRMVERREEKAKEVLQKLIDKKNEGGSK